MYAPILCSFLSDRILHRYPVITPDPKPWEVEFQKVQDKIENAHREMLVKELETTPDSLLIEERSLSPQEIMESMPFQPAPRVTEAGNYHHQEYA